MELEPEAKPEPLNEAADQPEDETADTVAGEDEQKEAGSPGEVKLDLGAYIRQAWEVVTQDLLNMIVGWLIITAILSTGIGIFVIGPLLISFLWMIRKRMNGEAVSLNNIFDGFNQFERTFTAGLLILLVCLVVGVMVMALFYIPCLGPVASVLLLLFVCTSLYFYFPIVAFSDTPVLEALSQSCKFSLNNIGLMLLLTLVTGIITNAGIIACGVGLFFTVPLALVMCVAAYNDYYLPNAE